MPSVPIRFPLPLPAAASEDNVFIVFPGPGLVRLISGNMSSHLTWLVMIIMMNSLRAQANLLRKLERKMS